MPWAKIDDGWGDHPKFAKVGPIGQLIHVRAINYCAHYLTDGLLSIATLRKIIASSVQGLWVQNGHRKSCKASQVDWIAKLVNARLLDPVPDDATQYCVHDFCLFNPTRDAWTTKNKQHHERALRAAEARWNKELAKLEHASSNATSMLRSSVPYDAPTRPVPKVLETTPVDKTNPDPPTWRGPGEASEAHASLGQGSPPSFDDFWAIYPRKVGKGAARKAWARCKGEENFRRAILAAVVAQTVWLEWRREHGRFIPNPATWLNQERWLDEPPATVRTGTDLSGLQDFATQEGPP